MEEGKIHNDNHGATAATPRLTVWDYVIKYIGVGSFGLALVAFICGRVTQSGVDGIQHGLMAMDHRPELVAAEGTAWRELRFVGDQASHVQGTTYLTFNVRIEDTLYVVNAGNATAVLLGKAVGDTTDGSYWLRDALVQRRIPMRDWTDLDFGRERLEPGETLPVAIDHTFVDLRGGTDAVLHCLVVYENELGALYDSYFWVRIHVPPGDSIVPVEFIDQSVVVRYPKPRIDQPALASVIYGRDEARRLRKNFDRSHR